MNNINENQSDIVISELLPLSTQLKEHIVLGNEMLEAYEGSLYPLDMLAIATLNRSMKNIKGFILLIQNRNIMCAGSLLRLQIDSCIRFFASFIVTDPHSFAIQILEGKQINQMKDKDGKKMNDSYLVDKMSAFAHWLPNVYKETSGYIHLSKKHYCNCMLPTNEDRTIQMHITESDVYITDNVYIETIQAFRSATELLFNFIYGWIYTKNNPDRISKLKEEFLKNNGREPNVFDSK